MNSRERSRRDFIKRVFTPVLVLSTACGKIADVSIDPRANPPIIPSPSPRSATPTLVTRDAVRVVRLPTPSPSPRPLK